MEQETLETKSRKREKIFVGALLAVIMLLYVVFLKEVLIPFLRLEAAHDFTGAGELLQSKGWMGFIAVILVEALQMVVIFVPAEFIQISSGLSYPFPIALLLCDLGVCMGATIIFVLVRVIHFQSSAYRQRSRSIERLGSVIHKRNTVLLMYLLFFMPIIPFGAICYYGSGRKLTYGKYILTVATGVIPSIIVSNLMGAAGAAFLVRDLPFWILILIILVLAAALFAVIYLFIDRVYLKEYDETPDSPMYALIFLIVRLWHGPRPRPILHEERLRKADAPYVLLANHQSFFDFYYIHQMDHPRNPTFLVNEYYCTRPILKTMGKRAGILSKKLFTTDLSTPVRIMRSLKKGYPVVIFPEGRLSPDGRSNPIVEEGGAFFRRLGADLVLVKLKGAYFAGPKWRSRRFRNPVEVSVEEVIKKEDLAGMTAAELNERISRVLYSDASEDNVSTYLQPDKAKGLDAILYRCADCGALYTTLGKGNTITCSACGKSHTLNEHYRFDDEPFTIGGWYDRIRELERAELGSLDLSAQVKSVIYGANGGPKRKEQGSCRLTREAFTYRSDKIEFSIPTEKLPALAFSCGKEYELYHQDELYYFYPLEEPRQVARWGLAVDLLAQERNEGKKAETTQK